MLKYMLKTCRDIFLREWITKGNRVKAIDMIAEHVYSVVCNQFGIKFKKWPRCPEYGGDYYDHCDEPCCEYVPTCKRFV